MTAKAAHAFIDLVKQNPELLKKLRSKTSVEEIIEMAANEGFIITQSDIEAVKGAYVDPDGNVLDPSSNDKTCSSGYCVW